MEYEEAIKKIKDLESRMNIGETELERSVKQIKDLYSQIKKVQSNLESLLTKGMLLSILMPELKMLGKGITIETMGKIEEVMPELLKKIADKTEMMYTREELIGYVDEHIDVAVNEVIDESLPKVMLSPMTIGMFVIILIPLIIDMIEGYFKDIARKESERLRIELDKELMRIRLGFTQEEGYREYNRTLREEYRGVVP